MAHALGKCSKKIHMDLTAVYAEEAIPRFSPVYIKTQTASNPMYRHMPNATCSIKDAQKCEDGNAILLGLAVTPIRAHNMASVVVNGVTRISNLEATNVEENGRWIVAKGGTSVKIGQIVHKVKAFDADGESDEYIVAVMPWVNHLTMRVSPVNLRNSSDEFAQTCLDEFTKQQEEGNAMTEEGFTSLFSAKFKEFCLQVIEGSQKQIL